MTKRLTEALILGLFLIIAVLLYRSTASYPPSVQGSTAMYVRFLGLALGCLCALELLLWAKNRGSAKKELLSMSTAPVRFWGVLTLLVAYSASLSLIGFYPASALFLPLTMALLGAKKPLPVVLTTAGVLLFVYLVFVKLLEVPLPQGTWF
jgi:putative tricarboxylic transport membrane protein